MSTGGNTKGFADVGTAFRDWILSLESIDLEPSQVVKDHPLDQCCRPAIWYEVVDTEGPDCLEISPVYVPSKVYIDLEVHSGTRAAGDTVFGELLNAMERHPLDTAIFDFDGTKVCSITPSNHDSAYEIKAPGSRAGDFVLSVFVELSI